MNLPLRICRNVTASATTLCMLAMSSLVHPAHADDSYSEDAVKAAYLYRFSGYVNWPNEIPLDSPFTIDVLGSPGIARELRRLLPGHPIKSRVVQVREINGVRDLGNAQIVYVAAGHSKYIRTLIPAAGIPAILLVSDEEGGLSTGSAVNFLTIDRNVRFEVSLAAADRWGLKISSELLGVAIRVLGSGRQSNLSCPRFDSAELINGRCGLRLADQSHLSRVSAIGAGQ
jgi:hypothetical protein